MLGNFVFDIDGAMAIAVDYEKEKVEKKVIEKLGQAYFEKHCLTALDYPHYIFPGYYALFRWLHAKGGKLFFFSSGIEARNLELAEKIIKRSFGDAADTIAYQVFSRKHCIDTRYIPEEEIKKYQSFHYGQRKKKLAGIVVPPEEIANSLLIEDDYSYMVKGEEYNLVCVRYAYKYLQNGSFNEDAYAIFHKAYYLAGLFDKMFALQEQEDISLMEAAKRVQIDEEGEELSRDFRYPGKNRVEYFVKGRAILQPFDEDTLKFYYPIPDTLERDL